jgi:pyruvate dehydrogenase E1 component beta subunit
MKRISYRNALNEALREEMTRDPDIIMLGEDIGPGGVMGVTAGLLAEFGAERIIDMPIAETAIAGAAVGTALAGLRPVAEIMHSDFLFICMDSIVNWMAKQRFLTGGAVGLPITIRSPYGARGIGPHHGQCIEACLQNIPGLKLVMPATPYDAKGLMKTAIRDNDPVIFFESKYGYNTEGEVPELDYAIPLGQAEIKRAGKDVTIVALGSMVLQALEAAEELAAQGIDCEILDPRTIVPLDRTAIIASVSKTRRAVIAHEAPKIGGVGGEIAALIAERAFHTLQAPIIRVGAPYTPVPRHPYEKLYLPDKDKIKDAVQQLF